MKEESSGGPRTVDRLRAILDVAVDGILTIDETGIMESVNPAAERIFGYGEREMIGRNVSMLMPSPDRERHDGYLARYLRTGEARIIGKGRRVSGRRRDGTEFPMELAVVEVPTDGGRRLFTGFVRDITERCEAEARMEELARTLREKNRELETILYVVSHDLRSPLVNIQGFGRELRNAIETLRQGGVTAEEESGIRREIDEALEIISASATRMDELLSGFLQFSRTGRAEMRTEVLDMNRLLADQVRALDYRIRETSGRVLVGDLPSCVGDRLHLGQLFANLLDNALKYGDPSRAPEIRVDGERRPGEVWYRVADNGVGIPEEQREQVFELFHRLSGDGNGQGLGLTIAQRIAERHRGRLWVEPQPGDGTTFVVALPDDGA